MICFYDGLIDDQKLLKVIIYLIENNRVELYKMSTLKVDLICHEVNFAYSV